MRARSAAPPASNSTRIFPPPSCNGCSRTCPARANGPSRANCAFGTVDSWLAYQTVRAPRHRCQQRLAHHALQHPHDALGPGLLALFGVPEAMLPEVVRSSGQVGLAREEWFGAADPPVRHRRRPAGRHLRPGLLRQGHGEEYLWHRLLHADALGLCAAGLAQPPAGDHRLEDRRPHRLPARGQRLHGRRHRAMAARRPGHHQGVERGRGAGDARCPTAAA